MFPHKGSTDLQNISAMITELENTPSGRVSMGFSRDLEAERTLLEVEAQLNVLTLNNMSNRQSMATSSSALNTSTVTNDVGYSRATNHSFGLRLESSPVKPPVRPSMVAPTPLPSYSPTPPQSRHVITPEEAANAYKPANLAANAYTPAGVGIGFATGSSTPLHVTTQMQQATMPSSSDFHRSSPAYMHSSANAIALPKPTFASTNSALSHPPPTASPPSYPTSNTPKDVSFLAPSLYTQTPTRHPRGLTSASRIPVPHSSTVSHRHTPSIPVHSHALRSSPCTPASTSTLDPALACASASAPALAQMDETLSSLMRSVDALINDGSAPSLSSSAPSPTVPVPASIAATAPSTDTLPMLNVTTAVLEAFLTSSMPTHTAQTATPATVSGTIPVISGSSSPSITPEAAPATPVCSTADYTGLSPATATTATTATTSTVTSMSTFSSASIAAIDASSPAPIAASHSPPQLHTHTSVTYPTITTNANMLFSPPSPHHTQATSPSLARTCLMSPPPPICPTLGSEHSPTNTPLPVSGTDVALTSGSMPRTSLACTSPEDEEAILQAALARVQLSKQHAAQQGAHQTSPQMLPSTGGFPSVLASVGASPARASTGAFAGGELRPLGRCSLQGTGMVSEVKQKGGGVALTFDLSAQQSHEDTVLLEAITLPGNEGYRDDVDATQSTLSMTSARGAVLGTPGPQKDLDERNVGKKDFPSTAEAGRDLDVTGMMEEEENVAADMSLLASSSPLSPASSAGVPRRVLAALDTSTVCSVTSMGRRVQALKRNVHTRMLRQACREGNTEKVLQLLSLKADVNAVVTDAMTLDDVPLVQALRRTDYEMTHILLRCGAAPAMLVESEEYELYLRKMQRLSGITYDIQHAPPPSLEHRCQCGSKVKSGDSPISEEEEEEGECMCEALEGCVREEDDEEVDECDEEEDACERDEQGEGKGTVTARLSGDDAAVDELWADEDEEDAYSTNDDTDAHTDDNNTERGDLDLAVAKDDDNEEVEGEGEIVGVYEERNVGGVTVLGAAEAVTLEQAATQGYEVVVDEDVDTVENNTNDITAGMRMADESVFYDAARDGCEAVDAGAMNASRVSLAICTETDAQSLNDSFTLTTPTAASLQSHPRRIVGSPTGFMLASPVSSFTSTTPGNMSTSPHALTGGSPPMNTAISTPTASSATSPSWGRMQVVPGVRLHFSSSATQEGTMGEATASCPDGATLEPQLAIDGADRDPVMEDDELTASPSPFPSLCTREQRRRTLGTTQVGYARGLYSPTSFSHSRLASQALSPLANRAMGSPHPFSSPFRSKAEPRVEVPYGNICTQKSDGAVPIKIISTPVPLAKTKPRRANKRPCPTCSDAKPTPRKEQQRKRNKHRQATPAIPTRMRLLVHILSLDNLVAPRDSTIQALIPQLVAAHAPQNTFVGSTENTAAANITTNTTANATMPPRVFLSPKMLDLLLAHGANPYVSIRYNNQRIGLVRYYVENMFIEHVEVLKKYNVDVNEFR